MGYTKAMPLPRVGTRVRVTGIAILKEAFGKYLGQTGVVNSMPLQWDLWWIRMDSDGQVRPFWPLSELAPLSEDDDNEVDE